MGDHKSRKVYYIFGILFLLLTGGYLYFQNSFGFLMGNGQQDTNENNPKILSFDAEKPYFIARGQNLERVEVWAIPTGTEVIEAEYVLLGLAEKSGNAWRFSIPENPILAADIFAKGFGHNGKFVTKSLPYVGASDLYNAVWGSGEHFSDERILRIGETQTIGGMNVNIVRLLEDSRCPQDVTCIWAGRVQIEASFETDVATSSALIATDSDPFFFNGFAVTIAQVLPIPKAGTPVDTDDYRINLRFRK